MSVLPFLTAWDPSDLPGATVDPLGFDRGYTWLADQLLPSLTNVARQPRYFSMLCASASLAPPSESSTPTRREIAKRQELVLRFERLWALGHAALEREKEGASAGIRGITYAVTHLHELERRKQVRSNTDFKLLLSQQRYGVLGIYGNVASGLRLTERGTLGLTSEWGLPLGEAFLDDTGMPDAVRKAALDDSERSEVSLDTLADWVRRSGVNAPMGSRELKTLASAFDDNDRRRRLGKALSRLKLQPDEREVDYLGRLEERLPDRDKDLRVIVRAVQLFEACYQASVLVLERLLWLCANTGSLGPDEIRDDPILKESRTHLRKRASAFFKHLDDNSDAALGGAADRLADLRRFLSEVADAGDSSTVVRLVVQRHTEVQAGKLFRGRSKLPWLEFSSNRLQLTLAQASQVSGEPQEPDDIAPHEYRLRSARGLILGNEVSE